MNRSYIYSMMLAWPAIVLMGSIAESAPKEPKIVLKTGIEPCHLVPRDSKVCIVCKKKLRGEELRQARLRRSERDKDLFHAKGSHA